jgi:hypothetical protein
MRNDRSALLAAGMLACLLQQVVGQVNPSALTMAKTIIDSRSLRLITSGGNKPSFTGPKGSSKLIKYWEVGANVEKHYLQDGAVKLATPADDKPVALKFSAIVKVRLRSKLTVFLAACDDPPGSIR